MRKPLLAAATVALVLAASSPAPAQEEDPPSPSSAPGHGSSGYGSYGYPEPPAPVGPAPVDPAPCQYEPGGCDRTPQYSPPYIPQPGEPYDAPSIGGEGPVDAPNLGDGSGPVEAATGDPEDAAVLNGAIEAARADRAGGIPPAAASEPAVEGGAPEDRTAGDAVATGQEVGGEEADAEQAVAVPAVEAEAGVEEGAPGDRGAVDVGGEDETRAKAGVEERASEGEDARDGAAKEGGESGDAEDGASAATRIPSDLPPDPSGAPSLVLLLGVGSVLLAGSGLLLRRLVR